MKNIAFLFILFLQTSLVAQINGNRNIVTKSFPLESLSKLEINLTADIVIDAAAKPGITITADENVLEYINLKTENGYLDLTQLDWIEPSKNPQVLIGAPNLKAIVLDAHSHVIVENLNAKALKVKANVGRIDLKGKLNTLDLKVKVGKANTEALELENADVTIKSWGKVWLGKVNSLTSNIDDSGTLSVEGEPQKLYGDAEEAIARGRQPIDKSIRYIKLKIRNNSLKRNHFYVVGQSQTALLLAMASR